MDISNEKLPENHEKHLYSLIKAIRKVNQLITKEQDRDKLISGACENLVSTRGFNNAWISLIDSSGKSIHIGESGFVDNLKQLEEMLEKGQLPQCAQKAMTQKELVVSPNTSINCPDCPLKYIYKQNAGLCIRLEYNKKIYGILKASVPQRFVFDPEEQALFKEVAEDIAFGLYNIEQEENQKRMLKKLRYSDERYRTIFEGAAEGILIVEARSKKFKYVNPAICKMLGYEKDELIKMNVNMIHPKKGLDSVISGFEEIVERGQGVTYNLPCLRKDGTIIYADFNTTSTSIEGTPCIVTFISDVTERKKLYDKLKESEERFKTLFEYAPDAYYLHDFDGRFIDGNKASEILTGYKKEELIGKTFFEAELLDSDGIKKLNSLLKKNKEELVTGPDELIIKRKDGKDVFIEIRTFPLTIGKENLVLAIARDISERKTLEKQLFQSQKLEAIGRLAGGVSHDFNNILTVIMANADLLLMEIPKNSPYKDQILTIRSAGSRAASLTRQLLAFSRKQILQPITMNLNRTVQDMEKILLRMIGEDIELKTILAPDLHLIEADPSQIEQVIMNLVINARDAMPQGGKLTIVTRNVELDEKYNNTHFNVIQGFYAMLSISDSGSGISQEIQEQIFEPFFTTKEMGKGTGLGLAMVYGIVKQSKGYIWVYSEEGKGTTFKIYLPRVLQKESKIESKIEKNENLTGSETILVVEDDEMVRNTSVTTLKRYGYMVLKAENGIEAISIANEYQSTIHLLVTDVVMPGIGIKEMEEKIKSTRPEIKILYMSGYTDDAIVHHGVLEPGKFFLGKPFTPESIGKKIREVLDFDEKQE